MCLLPLEREEPFEPPVPESPPEKRPKSGKASNSTAYTVMKSDENALVSESETLPEMIKSMMLDKNKSR